LSFKDSSGQQKVNHRAQGEQIVSPARQRFAISPLGWCESRRSPLQMIGLIDARGAFEIYRYQAARSSNNNVLRFAVTPDPAGAMHL